MSPDAALRQENGQLRRLAASLWRALSEYNRGAPVTVLVECDDDWLLHADVYRACEVIHLRHHILVIPCRRILTPVEGGVGAVGVAWPTQAEAYLGSWPDGSVRHLTRSQVLMMAGMDTGGDPAPVTDEMPF